MQTVLLGFSVLVKGIPFHVSPVVLIAPPGPAQVSIISSRAISTISLALRAELTFHSNFPLLHMALEVSQDCVFSATPQDHLMALNISRIQLQS